MLGKRYFFGMFSRAVASFMNLLISFSLVCIFYFLANSDVGYDYTQQQEIDGRVAVSIYTVVATVLITLAVEPCLRCSRKQIRNVGLSSKILATQLKTNVKARVTTIKTRIITNNLLLMLMLVWLLLLFFYSV